MKFCLNCMEIFDAEYEVCPYCGQIHGKRAKKESHLQPGSIINDRYVIGEAIGQGGFGITYVGWDKKLKQKVAVKEYYPTAFAYRAPEQTEVTALSAATERSFSVGVNKFINEARIIASLNDQPGIVHVFDYLTANNTAYIIMEFIEGKTVKDILNEKKDQRLAVSDVLRITMPILQALSKVHKRGAIHRDISPDNIMISNSGEVKLLDFGAARNIDPEEQQKLSVVLKASYAPPEQYGSTNVQNASTDIYALGAVLYKLTTGKMPEKSLERVREDNLINPRKINNAIPKWLDDIIMKCLQMKPEDRFQSADEFLEAIEAGRKGESYRSAKSSPMKKVVIAAIAVVAIAIAGFAWFMSNNSEEFESNLKILEYGYQYDAATGDINSALIVNNTSDNVLDNIYLTVTAKNEAGEVIGTATDKLEYNIGPNDQIGVTCDFYEVCSEVPSSIEINVSEMSISDNIRKEVRENGYATPDISISYQNGNYYECQIVNNNNYSFYGPVHVLYRDDAGNLIGGETVYASNEIEVAANSTGVAQIQVYNRLSDNCEVYVSHNWLVY